MSTTFAFEIRCSNHPHSGQAFHYLEDDAGNFTIFMHPCPECTSIRAVTAEDGKDWILTAPLARPAQPHSAPSALPDVPDALRPDKWSLERLENALDSVRFCDYTDDEYLHHVESLLVLIVLLLKGQRI